MIHEQAESKWSFQSPVAHSCKLPNHLNSFHGGMFKLKAKCDAYSLLYLLSHFEWDGHTVHMLTPQHLPPPMTSTVKSSLFTHVHSSPLFLAARLHWCHTNSSRYINNAWTFSGQTSYTNILQAAFRVFEDLLKTMLLRAPVIVAFYNHTQQGLQMQAAQVVGASCMLFGGFLSYLKCVDSVSPTR